MGEAVASDTAGARVLLSVVTEDDWLGFSKTGFQKRPSQGRLWNYKVGVTILSSCRYVSKYKGGTSAIIKRYHGDTFDFVSKVVSGDYHHLSR